MIYNDTEQLIIELKKLMLEKQISQKQIADRIGITPQGFTKLINKKNFSFNDLQKVLNAIDYSLEINFIENQDLSK